MYEIPPILKGSEREQLISLRDYLVRMARDLDENVEKTVTGTVQAEIKRANSGGGTSGGQSSTSDAVKRLQSLIVKTADSIQHTIDVIETRLNEDYLAISDFGAYQESIESLITSTARGTVEQFNAQFATLNGRLDDADAYLQTITGEIRRGIIQDPDTGNDVLGIAISQNLQFTGTEHTEGGLTYYEIDEGQTFGMYTSSGWQFWVDGLKCGWFESGDSSLHVRKIVVEDSITLGAGWLMTATSDGFGIRYVGVS